MSLLTNWGYTLTGLDALPDMLTAEELNSFTGGRYSGDVRIAGNIKAVSEAIREYCGWHVYSSAACSWSGRMLSANVAVNHLSRGSEVLIQLPARYVTAVASVTLDGTVLDPSRYILETSGLLRLLGVWADPYAPITVEYTAGLPDALMGSIKELVANRVTHALASSNGITSEASGGVSITYNSSWVSGSRATALTDDTRELLTPYRLQGVF